MHGMGISERRREMDGLQHIATHCNTLQHAATRCNKRRRQMNTRGVDSRTATHCSTLQHTTTFCNMLQHAATCCNTRKYVRQEATVATLVANEGDGRQRAAATHFNSLQQTATSCKMLQHAVTCCNTRQHTATHYNAQKAACRAATVAT